MTDLADSVASFQNTVARAGMFSSVYAETTTGGCLQYLRDGLAECQLEGILTEFMDNGSGVVSPDLTSGQVSLIVLMASIRFTRAELSNRVTSRKYVAGPTSYEETTATNVLRDIMKSMEAKKDRIIELSRRGSASSAFGMADSYLINLLASPYANYGDPLAAW